MYTVSAMFVAKPIGSNLLGCVYRTILIVAKPKHVLCYKYEH